MEKNFVELFKSEIMSIDYDLERDILRNAWLRRTIPDELAKSELENWVIYYHQTKPKYLITNLSGGFIIAPHMQEWMAHYLHPIVSKTVKKWAFILHSDIFSALSVQMAVEIIDELGFEKKFFDQNDDIEVMEWLL